jgi:DNA-binding PadR family transcriptional regulator
MMRRPRKIRKQITLTAEGLRRLELLSRARGLSLSAMMELLIRMEPLPKETDDVDLTHA